MHESEKWDRLLREALASDAEPEEKLNQSMIHRYQESNRMNRGYRKKLSAGVLVAAVMLLMSVTAYAATQLFSPKQVAERLGEQVLAEAFESGDAVEINQSRTSGDYKFTLHGIVSGKGLTALGSSERNINPDRSYAVLSIARRDGSPMPDTSDPAYGSDPFFVSPLIKGQKPWQVNIFTMNGGHGEFVQDGIAYRLIECDDVEMFADRGVYLAVSSGSSFFEKDAFAYDENTGEISARADYDGAAVLFDLPLDKAKADRGKADAYLRELLKEPSADAAADPAAAGDVSEADLARQLEEWKKKIPEGTVIPESVKEATYGKDGRIHYEFDGWTADLSPDQLFTEGQTGDTDAIQFSGDGQTVKALIFSRDESGVITGRIVVLK